MSLEIEGLVVSRGAGPVLRSVTLTVADGTSLALVGRNGAGKTTLLETIAGLLPAVEGSIRLDGTELRGLRAHRVAREGLALVPEGRQLFASMTVLENLAIGARTDRWWFGGPDRSRHERIWELFPALYEHRGAKVGGLSGGQQQMVTVARALMSEPKILLLDEPTFGLSPQVTEAMCDQLRRLGEAGITLLLAEQNVDVATDVATTVAVLGEGRIAAVGEADELYGQPVFREAMLG